jgi:hypothetical protein
VQGSVEHEEEGQDENEGEADDKEDWAEYGEVFLCGECEHGDANDHAGSADCCCSNYLRLILGSDEADHSRQAKGENSDQNVVEGDDSAEAAAEEEDSCQKVAYNRSNHDSETGLMILVNEIIEEVASQNDKDGGNSELESHECVDLLDEADSDISITELI